MKRVYTDERFPDIEVHNDGTTEFRVVVRQPDGTMKEEDTFHTYNPNATAVELPEAEAGRRAQSYFDRVAHGHFTDEMFDRDGKDDTLRGSRVPRTDKPFTNRQPDKPSMKRVQLPDEDGTETFNSPPPLDTLTSDDVLDRYEQAKRIADPVKREAAMKQVQSMSQQMESTPDEIVRHLLD